MILNNLEQDNKISDDLKIVTVKLKDDFVSLKVEDDESAYKLTVSLDDYLNYRLKENGYISYKQYDELKENEALILAYKSALRRLGIKDYSESKMRQALYQKYKLTKGNLDKVIGLLKEHDYLNDERYTKYRIDYLLNQNSSKRMIYKKLKEEGIEEELIDRFYPKHNVEIESIQSKANKYLKTIRNKSLNAKKNALLAKLVGDGFDMSLAKETIEKLDFKEDVNKQSLLLEKEYEKAFNKYSKKYEDYELKNRIYIYLLSKGFISDDINRILSKNERVTQ